MFRVKTKLHRLNAGRDYVTKSISSFKESEYNRIEILAFEQTHHKKANFFYYYHHRCCSLGGNQNNSSHFNSGREVKTVFFQEEGFIFQLTKTDLKSISLTFFLLACCFCLLSSSRQNFEAEKFLFISATLQKSDFPPPPPHPSSGVLSPPAPLEVPAGIGFQK
ncbi:hypothetical protein CDAR_70711 [Caerostris darwini]|uniref:Uncharacterized protein n=1 Tax=Caerostris darwini TaxID=1538125 RepID=A0AAV4WF84_9ARAC|nr:hypothetical protein CDAR_70711 [Caerostris darwini]